MTTQPSTRQPAELVVDAVTLRYFASTRDIIIGCIAAIIAICAIGMYVWRWRTFRNRHYLALGGVSSLGLIAGVLSAVIGLSISVLSTLISLAYLLVTIHLLHRWLDVMSLSLVPAQRRTGQRLVMSLLVCYPLLQVAAFTLLLASALHVHVAVGLYLIAALGTAAQLAQVSFMGWLVHRCNRITQTDGTVIKRAQIQRLCVLLVLQTPTLILAAVDQPIAITVLHAAWLVATLVPRYALLHYELPPEEATMAQLSVIMGAHYAMAYQPNMVYVAGTDDLGRPIITDTPNSLDIQCHESIYSFQYHAKITAEDVRRLSSTASTSGAALPSLPKHVSLLSTPLFSDHPWFVATASESIAETDGDTGTAAPPPSAMSNRDHQRNNNRSAKDQVLPIEEDAPDVEQSRDLLDRSNTLTVDSACLAIETAEQSIAGVPSICRRNTNDTLVACSLNNQASTGHTQCTSSNSQGSEVPKREPS